MCIRDRKERAAPSRSALSSLHPRAAAASSCNASRAESGHARALPCRFFTDAGGCRCCATSLPVYLLAMMTWGLRQVVCGRTALRNEKDAVRPPLREAFHWGRARVGRAPFRSVVLRGRTPAPQHRAPDERQARGLRRPPLEAARSRLLTFDGARWARRPAEGAPRASGSPHRAPDDERALARAAVGASRGGCRPGAAASRRQPRATPAGSEGRRSRERTGLALSLI